VKWNTNAFFQKVLLKLRYYSWKYPDKELSKYITIRNYQVFSIDFRRIDRLLVQKNLGALLSTPRIEYEKRSDTVQLFVYEWFWSITGIWFLIFINKEFFFCIDEGYKSLGKSKIFIERLNYFSKFIC
jgi:hypothetical protein